MEFYWGSAWDSSYCWFSWNGHKTHAASEHLGKGNAFGLVDMIGNVLEWCQDDYVWGYESGPKNHKPREGDKKDLGVYRGGCWYDDKESCRSAARSAINVAFRDKGVGFRVCRSVALTP